MPGARPPKPARRGSRTIPAYSLYGEAAAAEANWLHVEPIQSRSSRYAWEIGAHLHRGLHQLIAVESGPIALDLDDAHREAEGPLVVAIPAGVAHAFRFGPRTEGQVLTSSPRALIEGDRPAAGSALASLFESARVVSLAAGDPRDSRLLAMFRLLQDESASPGGLESPVPLWLARSIVFSLAQRVRAGALREERAASALFTRFVVLVEAHYLDHWPVPRYASQLGLSAERLNRIVRDETAKSALELIHDRLLREACRRLVFVAAPISTLAFDLGFDDPAYFCRFFKRGTGQSPRAYRVAVAQPG